ncbi:hypothetical protein MIMGU_mgv1a007227mg [Erythranthe guttata]|uniref:NHL repeat-containing protein n=1 Tax=Erythranthe guttata TaxID=4155 RepID=A0A022QR12_ERYGU|nr:hypothetical protein MIMGU_mgv1a007227mg [Erythranthe guttata]
MASPVFFSVIFLMFVLFHQITAQDGYTVSTVLDGDKSNVKVNPHSILHQSPPSDAFVLLDSVASTFYTVSLPTTSNETVIKSLAGNGKPGFIDGDLASARFNKPRSFAVDFNGNVYVADMLNRAVRKITKTGVTTIAGGNSQNSGRTDGPARDASFSNNFELTFIPQRCALMVSDHGNRLIRQINLKAADCKRQSGSVLGTTSAWLLGLGLSCLLSLILGFVIRPYVIPYGGSDPRHSSSWTQCLMSLEKQTLMLCSGIRSVLAKSTVCTPLMVKSRSTTSCAKSVSLLDMDEVCSGSGNSNIIPPLMVESRCTSCAKSVSLLDLAEVNSGSGNSNIGISSEIDDQLKDMISFGGGLVLPANGNNETVERKEEERESSDVWMSEKERVDCMIVANFVKFEEEASRDYSPESLQE